MGKDFVLQHEVLKQEYSYWRYCSASCLTALNLNSMDRGLRMNSLPGPLLLSCHYHIPFKYIVHHLPNPYYVNLMSALKATQMKYRWSERKVLRHLLHLVSAIPQFISRVLFCGMFYNMFFESFSHNILLAIIRFASPITCGLSHLAIHLTTCFVICCFIAYLSKIWYLAFYILNLISNTFPQHFIPNNMFSNIFCNMFYWTPFSWQLVPTIHPLE